MAYLPANKGLLLRGTATDRNLEHYKLEFATPRRAGRLAADRSRVRQPVVDGRAVAWVPPGPGTYVVRLVVAGSRRQLERPRPNRLLGSCPAPRQLHAERGVRLAEWRRRQGRRDVPVPGPRADAAGRPHRRPATGGRVGRPGSARPSLLARVPGGRSPGAHVGRPRRVRARRAGRPLHGPPRRRPVHGRGGQHAPGDRDAVRGTARRTGPQSRGLASGASEMAARCYGLSPPVIDPTADQAAPVRPSSSRCPRSPRTGCGTWWTPRSTQWTAHRSGGTSSTAEPRACS